MNTPDERRVVDMCYALIRAKLMSSRDPGPDMRRKTISFAADDLNFLVQLTTTGWAVHESGDSVGCYRHPAGVVAAVKRAIEAHEADPTPSGYHMRDLLRFKKHR